MKERSSKYRIDFLEVTFEVILTDDIPASRKKPSRSKMFGFSEEEEGIYYGLLAYRLGNVALFLNSEYLSVNTIAHEIFHATHRIWQMRDHHILINGHEPHAYLCGYLTDLVYLSLSKWKYSAPLLVPIGKKPTRSPKKKKTKQ